MRRDISRQLPLGGMLAVLLGCVAGAATAEESPRFVPTRDVAVNYDVTSDQPGVPPAVLVHISSAGLMRIDAGEQGYILYDRNRGRVRWVLPQAKIYVDLPAKGSLMGNLLPEAGAQFARGGGGHMAGLACTQWHVTAPGGSGDACVTQDGVILSGTGADRRGHTGAIAATSVSFAPQPAALFEPPPGFQHMSLPRGIAMPPAAGR